MLNQWFRELTPQVRRRRDLFYVALNAWALPLLAVVWGSRDSQQDMRGILLASAIGFGLFAYIPLAWARFTIKWPWAHLWLAFPIGTALRYAELRMARSVEKQDEEAGKRLRAEFEPFMGDICRFVMAKMPPADRPGNPLGASIHLDDDDVPGLDAYLTPKGWHGTQQHLRDLVEDVAVTESKRRFEQIILGEREPTSLNVEQWAQGFVEFFGHDERYFQNLLLSVRTHHPSLWKDSQSALRTIQSVVAMEKDKRHKLRLAARMGAVIDGGATAMQKVTLREVDLLDGHAFERLLEHLFRDMGFKVEPTRQTGDQGADLLVDRNAERAVVQAKRYSSNVGNDAVQQAVAAKAHYHCTRAYVVTNQYFTRPASELAASNHVALWDRDRLGALLVEYPQYLETLRVCA